MILLNYQFRKCLFENVWMSILRIIAKCDEIDLTVLFHAILHEIEQNKNFTED